MRMFILRDVYVENLSVSGERVGMRKITKLSWPRKKLVTNLFVTSKAEYFSDWFSTANAKDINATINGLLNKSTKALPVLELKSEKEMWWLSFLFIGNKVEKIRANVGSNVSDVVDESSMFHSDQVTRIHNFNLLTPGEIEKIVKNFPSKTCSLDTIPTWLVKDNLHNLLPILIKVVNSSLSHGTFLDTLKQSIITPVLKKSSLGHNIPKHYRLVANIKIMSKVIEKAAPCQVTSHIDSNGLCKNYQSSYKRFHSTETVKSDFLHYVDNNPE